MIFPRRFARLPVCLLAVCQLCAFQLNAQEAVDFNRDIQPILAENCFACHGPDANHREADLRLDLEEDANLSAIVPGAADDSPIMERLTATDPDEQMPPPSSGKSLTPEQVQMIRDWIDQGAAWAKHWAFVPPAEPKLPAPSDPSWAKNELDLFVLDRLDRERLRPSPAADRATLMRRVYHDLIGLPPTPAEVDAFVNDSSPNAFEKVVDRLLASPHYGERHAIEWLDSARFADTNGYQNDFNRSMWPWRDWMIRSLNDNKPYDQLVTEMLAGDLLSNPTQEQLVATGFNRNHRTVTEAGSIDEEWRVENVVDRVEATATTFLGLTMGCARCHDHKYDPITQKNFYQFFAYFNNVDEQGVYTETRGNVPPLISLPTPEDKARLAEFDRQIQEWQHKVDQAEINLPTFFESLESPSKLNQQSVAPPVLTALVDGQLLATEHHRENTQPATANYPAGTPTWIASPAGTALQFAGNLDAHVDFGQAVAIERDQPCSWSMWVRMEKPGALISKMDDDQAFRGFDTIVLDDNRLKVHLIHQWPDNAIAVTTKTSLPLNSWFHLCVSYDGSSKAEGLKIFVDGQPWELNLEQNSLQGTLASEQPLRIGRRSTALPFTGAISSVTFRMEATAQELAQFELKQTLRGQLEGNITKDTPVPPAMREYLLKLSTAEAQRELATIRQQRDEFEKRIQTVMIMRDRAEYRPTYVLKRGQYDLPNTEETLWPGLPEFLPPAPENAPQNRLGLAQWMTHVNHPLVARVAVNRIWQRLFGAGLVDTPDNFGVQGSQPSHPELLDWLAIEFVRSGWDMKRMNKLIVMSATYQQSSDLTRDLLMRDPANRLLARGPRHRLPAELVRDHALAVSGLLTARIGGPSVKPYQPAGLWDELAGGANEGPYVVDTGSNLYRRSLYTYRKRTVSHPTLATFDAPSWEICQAKRSRTNTPLQALALLNDVTYVEAARHLAARMITEGGSELDQQIDYGFRLVTSRAATEAELATLTDGYSRYLRYFRQESQAAESLLAQGSSQLDPSQRTPELAAMTTIASILLNLDESVTKH